MKASACPNCHAEMPAGAESCQQCEASSVSGTPDYTKVGLGALGNVHVEHKPVGTFHQETHYHQHPAAATIPRAAWLTGVVVLAMAVVLLAFNRPATVINIHPDATAAPVTSVVKPVSPTVDMSAVVEFDRPDRIYYDGEMQSLRITAPEAGYLYVASHWDNGQMRLLEHPAFKATAQPVQKGQIIAIPAVRLAFTPATPDASESVEEICVLVGKDGMLDIPGSDTADISQSWQRIASGSQSEPPQGVSNCSTAYRIKSGRRPTL